jgi:signal transduction histidine kinase
MLKNRDLSTTVATRLLICSKAETKRLSFAESDMPVTEGLYELLRRLAVEDPREAKKLFLATFEANSHELSEFLTRLRKPNEGRLRQVVANSVRAHPEKGRIIPELVHWRETETDEFTRRAIEGALVDVDSVSVRTGTLQEHTSARSELADTYRYVSDRLRHRLRNTMLSAQAQANRLKKLMTADLGSEVQTIVAKLNDAMVALAREVEATQFDPEHFRHRSVALADWLRQLNLRYATQYTPVTLRLVNIESPLVRIFANDYLLETIFWNIWVNAHQATGASCEIIIVFGVTGRELELLISDNGEGFARELRDIVFQQIYSTKNLGRGRGLLEIQDAVERLAGRIELYEAKPEEYRIRIRLPLDVE